MEVKSGFEIAASVDEAWELLLDVPRIIPCMPGAELVAVTGDNSWTARVTTRLGPVGLSFEAEIERERVDQETHTVTLKVDARERSGRGGAVATIVNRLEETDGHGFAHVATDLMLTGTVARFGRAGLVKDVAKRMTEQFAANLRQELVGPTATNDYPQPEASSATAANGRVDPFTSEQPKVIRPITAILLRATIARLQRLLARVEARR